MELFGRKQPVKSLAHLHALAPSSSSINRTGIHSPRARPSQMKHRNPAHDKSHPKVPLVKAPVRLRDTKKSLLEAGGTRGHGYRGENTSGWAVPTLDAPCACTKHARLPPHAPFAPQGTAVSLPPPLCPDQEVAGTGCGGSWSQPPPHSKEFTWRVRFAACITREIPNRLGTSVPPAPSSTSSSMREPGGAQHTGCEPGAP